jgi:hypothetical protein
MSDIDVVPMRRKRERGEKKRKVYFLLPMLLNFL